MIVRNSKAQTLVLQCSLRPHLSTRQLHQQRTAIARIPPPTPFVPDPKTFLTLIGRNLSKHAAKIPTWESLFSLTSSQFRELGVEPARSRRYLLWWRDRFRKGIHGIGGDLKHVVNGVGEVRVVEEIDSAILSGTAASSTPVARRRKFVVNMPPETIVNGLPKEEIEPVQGYKVRGAHTVVGPHAQPVKGTDFRVALIKVKDGLWEQRRGVKVDGGERRKVAVRTKRRLEEAKATQK
ncbi:hypothetical protein MMC12_004031 [Toensbergia leucococca]|nr:hypothetical protein [Toensbergia leucococca]